MLRCIILCTLVSGKLDKVFQVSLASIAAGCQHYRKHLGKLSSVACKKIFRTLKLVAIWLRVHWNEDVNCIRPIFGSYTSPFHDNSLHSNHCLRNRHYDDSLLATRCMFSCLSRTSLVTDRHTTTAYTALAWHRMVMKLKQLSVSAA